MNGIKKISIISLSMAMLLAILFPKEASSLSLSASGAILMEQESGRVLFDQEGHKIKRIASITKIMTAIIAIESGKMDETVKVSKQAAYTEGSSIYLTPNEKVKLEDLVYGLMLRSGNDASIAIAEHVGGSVEGFVFMMNQKATEIGMENTVFSNPSGLDDHEEHYSTPYDMALLTRYAMNNDLFKKISGTKDYIFEREEGRGRWVNKNRLLTEKYKYTTGGKTGFTKRAGRTLVTTATKKGMDLIAVTLNAGDDWNDHIAMYEHGFNHYKMKTIVSKGKINDIHPLPVDREVFVQKNVRFPLAKKEEDLLRIKYKLISPKDLENTEWGTVGQATIYFEEKPTAKLPIFIKEKKENKKRWWQILKKSSSTGRCGDR